MPIKSINLSKDKCRSTRRADDLRHMAVNMKEVATWIETCANALDDDGAECECCGAFRYRSFGQHILKEKIAGAASRIRDVAQVLLTRADDPEFADHRGGMPTA